MTVHTQGWDGSKPVEHGNFFDSRDIIARIEYLEQTSPINREPDEQDELDGLYEFVEEVSGQVPDWDYGATFIQEEYFETYAQEFANDIGAVNADAAWPLSFIDWEAAAEALKADYQEFDFTVQGDRQTYWVR